MLGPGTHAGEAVALCRTDRLTGRATGLPAKSCKVKKYRHGEEGVKAF